MRTAFVELLFLLMVVILCGCSAGFDGPISAEKEPVKLTPAGVNHSNQHLWAYYDVVFDPETNEFTGVENRTAMFTMNLVGLLNGYPASLDISFNGITSGQDYMDLDFDVSITHPIPDASHLNVYDVRGVYIAPAGAVAFAELGYTSYPHVPLTHYYEEHVDHPGGQEMMDDPVNGDGGGPDGYSRWFNPCEFLNAGPFGYTKGTYASDIEALIYEMSVLNPYKFFADGLGSHDDLVDWINANPGSDRVFSSGATNTRNYFVRFAGDELKFGYAILANWESPTVHPSNMREAIACEVIYGVAHTDEHVFTFRIYDPQSEVNPDNGVMEDYTIHLIEVSDYKTGGTIFNSTSMTPTATGDGWAEYHYETDGIPWPVDYGFDFWIIPEYTGYDHSNEFGIPNDVEDTPLAAWFCYELEYSDEPWN